MRGPFAVALMLATLAAGCEHAGQRHAAGSRLVFTGLAGEPDTLNPILATEADVLNFTHLYMSYLVENDAGGNAIPEAAAAVPTLANSGISPDQRTVTYHLRPNLRWQDGAPLTARDVVFSYRAIVNPRNNVITRVGYAEVAAIRAPDDRTVVVRLRRPFSRSRSIFLGPRAWARSCPSTCSPACPISTASPTTNSPSARARIAWRDGIAATISS